MHYYLFQREEKAASCRLTWNARIYALWIDRNAQVHGEVKKDWPRIIF